MHHRNNTHSLLIIVLLWWDNGKLLFTFCNVTLLVLREAHDCSFGLTIWLLPVRQPWLARTYTFVNDGDIHKRWQGKTNPCAYSMGHTVCDKRGGRGTFIDPLGPFDKPILLHIKAWISNHIHFMWDAIMHLYPNIINSIFKPPLCRGHGWENQPNMISRDAPYCLPHRCLLPCFRYGEWSFNG